MESAASGFLAGVTAASMLQDRPLTVPPPETALGALITHITNADARHFQPMNVNYGLFPELPGRMKKKEKRRKLAERALEALDEWRKEIHCQDFA